MAFDANDLRDSEHFVIQRTREGAIADFSSLAGGDGSQRTVRAGFLRTLLMGANEGWPVQLTGVRIKGARIEGELDLSDCAGAGGAGLPALSLEHCEIEARIDVSNARFARLSLNHSRLTQVNGRGAAIDGPLSFAGVRPFADGDGECWLCFRNAEISGDCSGRGARLVMGARAIDGMRPFTPLDLEGARIAGNLYLDKGGKDVLFAAKGAVNLSQSRIGGSVYLVGELAGDSGDRRRLALAAQNLEVGGDFSASTNLKVNGGKVSLRGAVIAKNLNFREAELSGGDGVDAGNARVLGSALFEGANIKGEVTLAGARIEGDLNFGGGRFIHGGNWAIRAPKARVSGDVNFKLAEGLTPHGRKTVIEGGANFDGAEIQGAMAWESVALRGPGPVANQGAVFSFADAVIGGALQARSMEAQADARIDASGASCAALDDDVDGGWGANNSALDLEGFNYARVESDAPWRKRLAWLKRAKRQRFSPQPYTHLAQVYARAGRREDARRILLAQHDARTLTSSPGPTSWALSSLFGLIAGYGLAPLRAARALALFLALGVFGVLAMNAQGALVTPEGRQCNGAVEPALYAIDVALPFIDLGQQSACAPGRTARADLPAGMALGESEWRLFEGVAMWRWAHALYAMLGAILAALAVLTFSGVMKPKEQ